MNIDDFRFQYSANTDIIHRLIEIDDDRYGGCYSGAPYTAWPGVRPDDIDAGDGTCEDFWKEHANALHGRGATPQAAFRDLIEKIGDQWWAEGAVQFVSVGGTPYLYDSDAFRAWLAQ